MPKPLACRLTPLLLSVVLRLASAYHGCVHDQQLPHAVVSHEVPYGTAHPFHETAARWGADDGGEFDARRSPRRLLQEPNPYAASANEWRPVRFAVHIEPSTTHEVDAEVTTWLENDLIANAVRFWSGALDVAPASDGLGLTMRQLQGCGGVSVDTEASADAISADSDFVLVVTTDETGTCAGASGGGADDGVGCAASACRNASQACSTSHNACTVIAAQCTDDLSCLIAQAACQASISVCTSASGSCQLAMLTCSKRSDSIAFGGGCVRDQYDRPVAGRINICPKTLPAPADIRDWQNQREGGEDARDAAWYHHVALHEMAHALGFTRGSLALFRDADAGGAPRTPRVNGGFAGEPDVVALNNTYGVSESTVQWSSERGHDQCDPVKNPAACVFHLVTPAVRQAARNHFGCDTLPGAELENQPTVGGVLGSHLEMRLFMGEVMSPISLLTPYVSQVTLAFFHDSGWYRVPDPAAKAATADTQAASRKEGFWGWQQGCEFATETCLAPVTELGELPVSTGSPPHFCSKPNDIGCTFDRRSLGRCMMQPMVASALTGAPLYPEYSYFKGTDYPNYGGAVAEADFCPFYVPVLSCETGAALLANDATASDAQAKGQIFGASSLCLTSTLNNDDSGGLGSVSGACYQTECVPKSRAMVVSTALRDGTLVNVTCSYLDSGASVTVPGIQGQLVCPDVDFFCGTSGYCGDTRYTSSMSAGVQAAAILGGAAFLLYATLCILARHRGAGPFLVAHVTLVAHRCRAPVFPTSLHPLVGLARSVLYHVRHSYAVGWLRPNVSALQVGDPVKVAMFEQQYRKGAQENVVQVRLTRPDDGHALLTLPTGSAPLPHAQRGAEYVRFTTYTYTMRVRDVVPEDEHSAAAVTLALDSSAHFMLNMANQPKTASRARMPGGEMAEPLHDPAQHETIDLSEMGDVTQLDIQRRIVPVSGILAAADSTANPLASTSGAAQFTSASAVWKGEFGRDHLVVPPLKDLHPSLRPRTANPIHGAGRSHRRVMAFFLHQGMTLFFLTVFETSSGATEKNEYCNDLFHRVMVRSTSAAVLHALVQYAAAVVRARMRRLADLSLELMPIRLFNVTYLTLFVSLLSLDVASVIVATRAQSVERMPQLALLWAWALVVELGVCWPILIGLSGLLLHDFATEEQQEAARTLVGHLRRVEEAKRATQAATSADGSPRADRRDNPFFRDNIEEGDGERDSSGVVEMQTHAVETTTNGDDVFDRACK